ncbi:MAG: hypothetical protein GC193_12140 [Cryomorphaceae bacterium]|nr:hypothetical protein [Cryomorphaceae bacterium]
MQARWRWQCKKCSNTITLKGGTIMKNSNLPISLWLKAMNLFTQECGEISALSLKSRLGFKRYEPAWYLLHKLRSAIGVYIQDSKCSVIPEDVAFSGFLDVKEVKIPKHATGCLCEWASTQQTKAKITELPVENANKRLKILILNEPKYIVLHELSPCEKDHPRRRFALKKITSQNVKHQDQFSKHLLVERQFKSALFHKVKNKLLRVHRGVSMRYVQQYLQEFNYFNAFVKRRQSAEILLKLVMTTAW